MKRECTSRKADVQCSDEVERELERHDGHEGCRAEAASQLDADASWGPCAASVEPLRAPQGVSVMRYSSRSGANVLPAEVVRRAHAEVVHGARKV